jgi:hypothetical protein
MGHALTRMVTRESLAIQVSPNRDGDRGIFEPCVTVSSTLLGQVRNTPLVRTHFLSLTSSR